MDWWFWVAIGAGGGMALLWLARSSFRRAVRQEFLQQIKRTYPEAVVAEERDDRIVLRSPSFGEVQVRLARLYYLCVRVNASADAREPVIRRFLAGLNERAADLGPLSLDRHGHRLLPRVVPRGFLEKETSLLHRPLGETGLLVAYVVDGPHSVAYLARRHLAELGLSEEQLHERALKNLEAIFSPGPVWKAAAGHVVAIQMADSHDATRMLLIPENLPAGGEVAVLVPDSDTLVLAPVPRGGEWGKIASLCVPAGGKPVLPGIPLIATRAGYVRAPGF